MSLIFGLITTHASIALKNNFLHFHLFFSRNLTTSVKMFSYIFEVYEATLSGILEWKHGGQLNVVSHKTFNSKNYNRLIYTKNEKLKILYFFYPNLYTNKLLFQHTFFHYTKNTDWPCWPSLQPKLIGNFIMCNR